MKQLKTLIAAAAVAGTALAPLVATPAAADDYRHRPSAGSFAAGDCVYRHGKRICGVRNYPRGPRPVYRNDNGDAAAAAIIGLAGVAIIAGALANANPPTVYETYPAPDTRYPPAPGRSGPKVITYASTLEPWTRGWYEWCDDRYRSFNPETGTYRGYDGRDHFCVPK